MRPINSLKGLNSLCARNSVGLCFPLLEGILCFSLSPSPTPSHSRSLFCPIDHRNISVFLDFFYSVCLPHFFPHSPVTLDRKVKVYGIFLYTLVYCVNVENLATLISNRGRLEARSLRTKWTLKIWLVVSIILPRSALIKVVTRGSLLKASILAKSTPMLSAKGLHYNVLNCDPAPLPQDGQSHNLCGARQRQRKVQASDPLEVVCEPPGTRFVKTNGCYYYH